MSDAHHHNHDEHHHHHHYSDMQARVPALETLLTEKGLIDPAAIDAILALQESWKRAAEATPHGSPVALENDPLR